MDFNGLTDDVALLQSTLVAARRAELLCCLLPECITSEPSKRERENSLKTAQLVVAADVESHSLDNMLRWKERLRELLSDPGFHNLLDQSNGT